MRPALLAGLISLALAVLAAGILLTRLRREEQAALVQTRDGAAARTAQNAKLAPLDASPSSRPSASPADEGARTGSTAKPLVLAIFDPDGQALPGARVVLFRGARILGQAVTGETGEARFKRGGREAEVAVWSASVPAHRQALAVLEGRHEIHLDPGTAVAGVVLVDGRVPTEHFDVWLESDSQVRPTEFFPPEVRTALDLGLEGFNALRTRVGEGGRFRFSGLPRPWSGRIRWQADLYPTEAAYDPWDEPQRKVELADARVDVVLELAAAGVIAARFVDTAGTPIASSTVSLDTRWGAQFGLGDPSGADGTYRGRVQLPLPEDIILTVDAPGRGSYTACFKRPASAVALWDLGDVVVPPEPELRVKVHDELGLPIAGATVGRWMVGHGEGVATDLAGTAVIRVAQEFERMPVEHPDYAPALVPAPADLRATLGVTLRRKAQVFLDFEVRPAGSEERLWATLEPAEDRAPRAPLQRPAHAVRSLFPGTLPDLDGPSIVPAGVPLRLLLTDCLGRSVHEELLAPVAPGATVQHRVQLDWQPATLRLRTFDAAGFPLPRAAVLLDGSQRLWTEPDGRLELRALASGPLAVAIVHPSHIERTLFGVVLGPESVPFEVHLAHR